MNTKYKIFITLAIIFTSFVLVNFDAKAVTSGVDYNDTNDLTTYFNDDGSPQFSGQATGGINNTGSVNVPIPSNDIWTTKQGYSVSGAAGSVYTFSAYFKVAQNSGYGNLGFSNSDTNTPDGIGQPATGIGVNFHGGGGAFVNNGTQTILSWPPDLVLGNWYFFTFEVTTKGSNTFDLKLQIWNTDATGVLGTMKTEKTQTDVVNGTMGSASTIHGFFSAAGSRMSVIDNFEIDLEGATFVEEGAPVVISGESVSSVTTSTAVFGGNVIDDNGAAVTSRGVCWSTSASPTTSGNCAATGTGTGTYSTNLSGLTPNTTYYTRAFAINSVGTSYGSELNFTTEDGPALPSTDSDGIDNSVEAAAPNSGDANNDGTADNTQANVGSFVNSITDKYVSIESPVDCTLMEAETMSESSEVIDVGYDYSNGLVNFRLECGTVGGSYDVSHYFYGVNSTDFVLRKYNSNTNSYSTISNSTLEVIQIDGENVLKVTYTLVDGGELDLDGAADGFILDPVGIGTLAVSLPDTGFKTSSFLYYYFAIGTVILLLGSYYKVKTKE